MCTSPFSIEKLIKSSDFIQKINVFNKHGSYVITYDNMEKNSSKYQVKYTKYYQIHVIKKHFEFICCIFIIF